MSRLIRKALHILDHEQAVRRSIRSRLLVRPLEDRAVPTTFTVLNTLDAGPGSLRQAVLDANADAVPDDIVFDATTFATTQKISLTTGQLDISNPVAIDASKVANVKIDAGGLSRIADTTFAAPGTVLSFNNLTLMNGAATGGAKGGAVLITEEVVTFTNCTFTNNKAVSEGGAVCATGDAAKVTMNGCTFTGNSSTGPPAFHVGAGGAIAMSLAGSLTLNRCTVSGNTASGNGGGVYMYFNGSLTVIDSTVSGNTAQGQGSGLGGGGLYGFGPTLTMAVRNSTISGNQATAPTSVGGGILLVNFHGSLTVENSTIAKNGAAANGGGIGRAAGTGTFTLSSTVVAQNTAPTPDLFFNTTTNVGGDSNLIGVVNTGNFTLTGAGNKTGTALLPLDAKLGALASNGGPTQTHLPQAGSSAIDAGNNAAAFANDQRGPGFPRALGPQTDIGAVEVSSIIPSASGKAPSISAVGATPQTIAVTYNDDIAIDVGTLDSGDIVVAGPGGSFPVAFKSVDNNTNGTPRVATYEMAPPGGTWDAGDNGVYAVQMAAGQVFDTDASKHSVAAGPIGAFNVAVPTTFVVANANESGPGSLRQAVLNANAFTPSNDTITFDPAFFTSAKTILLTSATLSITDSVTIQGPGQALAGVNGNNKLQVFNINVPGDVGNVSISGLTVTKGNSAGDGGAIFNANENLTITNSTVSDSTTATQGGGIAIGDGGNLALVNSTVSGNSAGKGGGVYFPYNGGLTVTHSTVSGNSSTGEGGGIYFYGSAAGTLTVTNSTISGNTSILSGAGIMLRRFYGSLVIQNSTITGNNATNGAGGGVAKYDGTGSITLQSTIVAGNTNASARDVFLSPPGNVPGNNNLIGVADVGDFTLTGSGNKTGTTASPLVARLGSLANNGGPTMTHSLLTGSPARNAGNNAAGLTSDQRGSGFVRESGPSADIGAFEVQLAPCVPPGGVVVNKGSSGLSRSRVTNLTVTFDQVVNFPANPADAFQLKRQSDSALAGLTAAVDNTSGKSVVTIAFLKGTGATESETAGPFSLQDGRYTMTIDAAKVSNANGSLDGDCNGIGGDNFVLVGNEASAPKLFRFFGDHDGDGDVDGADFIDNVNGGFASSFLGSLVNFAFDFDNDGDVDATDFGKFLSRYLITVLP